MGVWILKKVSLLTDSSLLVLMGHNLAQLKVPDVNKAESRLENQVKVSSVCISVSGLCQSKWVNLTASLLFQQVAGHGQRPSRINNIID